MISTESLSQVDPKIAELVQVETKRKEFSLEMIASENCVSEAVLEVQGSILTDKYCEGYPGRRYYGGCQYYDEIEKLARDRAKELFGAERANVQPHSGANANTAVFMALVEPGDTVMGLRLDHGGHLTHGSPVNFSGLFYNIAAYGVNPETGLIEEEEVMRVAKEHKPKLIVAGATAYSRQIDWAMFRRVADEVGAKVLADVSHYAGLIVGGVYDNPYPHVDVVTTTTHKTLRGPRGGLILCKKADYKAINKAVFPGLQGGPLMHQIAAKAVAFGEALKPEFKTYASDVIDNARVLASGLQEKGLKIVSGGTDAHVMILDLTGSGATGADAEEALGVAGITVNKNTIPNDPNPPALTSGVRLGTPALTTRGFDKEDMKVVAECIAEAIAGRDDDAKLAAVNEKVVGLCKKRPLFPHRLEA